MARVVATCHQLSGRRTPDAVWFGATSCYGFGVCGVLALSFILVTAAEIAILVAVGGAIGGWATFGLVIATGIAGAALAKHQGAAVLRKLRDSLVGGADPTLALVDGALVLAAGVTLLSPGFLTDATGLLLLVPPIRAPIARRLHRYFSARAKAHLERSFVINLDNLGDIDDEDPPPPGVIDADGRFEGGN